MKHELKIQPQYYESVRKRVKTFEIRRNDRNFKVGDILVLNEFNPETNELTGKWIERKVVYITDYAQQENYVVMSII